MFATFGHTALGTQNGQLVNRVSHFALGKAAHTAFLGPSVLIDAASAHEVSAAHFATRLNARSYRAGKQAVSAL